MPFGTFVIDFFSVFLILLLIIILLILTFAGIYGIFKKANLNGYKIIVPIYNFYLLFKISGIPGCFSIFLYTPIINIFIFLIFSLSLAKAFTKSILFGIGMFFFPTVFFLILSFDSSFLSHNYKFNFLKE